LFEDIKLTTEKGPIKSQKVTDGIIKWYLLVNKKYCNFNWLIKFWINVYDI
jgi:hypothetical protein